MSISQSFLHPVASLAATSASSFPTISLCAGTQWSSGSVPFLRSKLIKLTINRCPDCLSGFFVERMAPGLSVKIVALLINESVWDRCSFKCASYYYAYLSMYYLMQLKDVFFVT